MNIFTGDSKQTKGLLDAGFSLIMSFVDKFYLDWGYGTWLGREHLYTFSSWQVFTQDVKQNPVFFLIKNIGDERG